MIVIKYNVNLAKSNGHKISMQHHIRQQSISMHS